MTFLSKELFQPNKNAWDFITGLSLSGLCEIVHDWVYNLNKMISSYFGYLSNEFYILKKVFC